jgi:hypothetical protein
MSSRHLRIQLLPSRHVGGNYMVWDGLEPIKEPLGFRIDSHLFGPITEPRLNLFSRLNSWRVVIRSVYFATFTVVCFSINW